MSFTSTRYRLRIETLTPLHIGSGDILKGGMDYVTIKGRAAVVDERRVFDLLGPERIPGWVSCIEHGRDLLQFLSQHQKGELKPEDVGRTVLPLHPDVKKDIEIRTMIRTGLGHQPFLPGSSLKGAVRTALMAELLLDEIGSLSKASNVWQLRDKLKNYLGKPNEDIFRLFRPGDIHFDRTGVYQLHTVNLKGKGWMDDRQKQIGVECVPAGCVSMCEVSYPKETLLNPYNPSVYDRTRQTLKGRGQRRFQDLEAKTWLKTAHQKTLALLEQEIALWDEEEDTLPLIDDYHLRLKQLHDQAAAFNPGQQALLRIGFGSGYTSMTGGWTKEVKNDDLYDEIDNAVRRRGNRTYLDFYFPKTRRMTSEGAPFGFVKLSLEDG